jgi:hypothetical protein
VKDLGTEIRAAVFGATSPFPGKLWRTVEVCDGDGHVTVFRNAFGVRWRHLLFVYHRAGGHAEFRAPPARWWGQRVADGEPLVRFPNVGISFGTGLELEVLYEPRRFDDEGVVREASHGVVANRPADGHWRNAAPGEGRQPVVRRRRPRRPRQQNDS